MNNTNYEQLPHKFILLRKTFFLLISISFIIQLVVGDIDNLISSLICLISSWLTIYLVLRQNIFTYFLLPSFVIISFNISVLSGPLILQSITLTPITFNLLTPVYTFVLTSIFQFSLIISLFIFKHMNFNRISNKLYLNFNQPIGITNIPSNKQLWIMGFLGLSILISQASKNFTGGIEFGNVGAKFLDGLSFLTYAPFLIPLIYNVNFRKNITKKNYIYIFTYFLLLVVVSLGLNSRGAFVNGIATILVLYTIFIITGQIVLSSKLKKQIAILCISLIVILPQFSDLATSMVIVRTDRGDVPPIIMIEKTFEVFLDKERIKSFNQNYLKFNSSFDYNEAYLNNPFLDRFIYIKFFDNMIYLPNVSEGKYSEKILSLSLDKIVALLPTPIINLLGLNINKNELLFSMGDYMTYLEKGTAIGSFKVGSTVGHGFAIFGYLLFIIMIPLYILFFLVIQSFTFNQNGKVFILPVIMLIIMKFYFISINGNFFGIIEMILRELPQTIFLFLIVYHSTKLLNTKAHHEN